MGTVMGSPARRYGIALCALAAATQMTQQCTPLRAPLSFWPFLLAVLVSVWSGGAGPGLLAGLGSTLAISYLLLPPVYSLQVGNLDDFLWLELFGLASVLLGRGAHPEPPGRGCVVGPSHCPGSFPTSRAVLPAGGKAFRPVRWAPPNALLRDCTGRPFRR